ncbi:MAG: TlpA family protein disulfide reductase, partial [Muribaculaceae bacterium]|nr:TlpA family protein disulfide reductase [Muribaculaceae bacterium]
MNKGLLLIGIAGLAMSSCGSHTEGGNVTIHLPENYGDSVIVVSHVSIDNIFNAQRQEDLKIMYDTLEVKSCVAMMELSGDGAAQYSIEPPMMMSAPPEFYASPGETLVVDIKSFEPLSYTVTGSELMDDMTALKAVTGPIQQEYMMLVSNNDSVPEAEAKAMMERYDAAIKRFVAEHADSPVVPYAILDLSGDDFKKIYDTMSPAARNSILMPYAELYNRQVEDMVSERQAEEARRAEVASGTITAPDFTLPDLSGRRVSLSDFRGKWVVLDFWGSWCGWCVKGFPALKEAYKQYGDKVVIIGIDCNESEADWRAGVKQHQLPWLNLYNGNDKKLYEEYKIEGFPTKAIIN